MQTILEIILFLAAVFFAVRSFYLLAIAEYIKVGSIHIARGCSDFWGNCLWQTFASALCSGICIAYLILIAQS